MTSLNVTPIYVPESETMGSHLSLDNIFEVHKTITDETGVALGSDRVPTGQGNDFDYRQCPYSDSPSRNVEGRMISGLEHDRLKHSYPDIRRYLLAARAGYLALPTIPENHTLQVIDGVNILAFMHYLPAYLVNRADNPVAVQGELPRHIVVGSNSASGGSGGIGAVARGKLDLPLASGEAALQAVEDKGTLVGKKTVCAASPRMITNFLNLVREGSSSDEFGDIAHETHGLLPADEFGQALVFGCRMEELYGIIEVMAMLDGAHAKSLAERIEAGADSQVWPIMKSFHGMLSPLIAKCVSVTSDLNVCLGRDPIAQDDEEAEIWKNNTMKMKTLTLFRETGPFKIPS